MTWWFSATWLWLKRSDGSGSMIVALIYWNNYLTFVNRRAWNLLSCLANRISRFSRFAGLGVKYLGSWQAVTLSKHLRVRPTGQEYLHTSLSQAGGTILLEAMILWAMDTEHSYSTPGSSNAIQRKNHNAMKKSICFLFYLAYRTLLQGHLQDAFAVIL